MANKMTKEGIDYLKDHYYRLTDQEIAEKLGVTQQTIYRTRKKLGLTKNLNQNEVKALIEEEKFISPDKTNNNLDKDDEQILHNLYLSSRGRNLKKILSPQEMIFFCEEWVKFHHQFEDLTHTEQNTIETIICLRLRMHSNQEQLSKLAKERDQLGPVNIATLDLDDEEQARMLHKVTAINSAMVDLNKEYRELLEKITVLYKSLNATREQREAKGRITKETFFNLCEAFKQEMVREKEGRMAELLRLAAKKNSDKLRQPIKFVDGEMSPQLIDDVTMEMTDSTNTEKDDGVSD